MEQEIYNYYEAMEDDICDYIEHNVDLNDFEDSDALFEVLESELWVADSVTGNGDRHYANEFMCGLMLAGNYDLVNKAMHDLDLFSQKPDINAQLLDTLVRCYIFHECLRRVCDGYLKY